MKNMKQALLVAGCLLATTTLFAQTEKGGLGSVWSLCEG